MEIWVESVALVFGIPTFFVITSPQVKPGGGLPSISIGHLGFSYRANPATADIGFGGEHSAQHEECFTAVQQFFVRILCTPRVGVIPQLTVHIVGSSAKAKH